MPHAAMVSVLRRPHCEAVACQADRSVHDAGLGYRPAPEAPEFPSTQCRLRIFLCAGPHPTGVQCQSDRLLPLKLSPCLCEVVQAEPEQAVLLPMLVWHQLMSCLAPACVLDFLRAGPQNRPC